MTEYVTTTPGLYPLPDWSKEELSDLKGHQKHDLVGGDEPEEVVEVYDRGREEVMRIQEDAELDLVVEGQLRWDDMLAHPLCVHENVETRGLLRYYDNNNFYREPVVTGELTHDGDVARELEKAAELTDRLQGVVPGPYSLFDLATNEFYGDDEEFLAALSEFLAGEVEAFPETEALFVLEPSLVTTPPEAGLAERASEAIDAVAAAADADVIVHTYWGALSETTHARLLDADVDAVGYDLVSAPEESVELVSEYGSADDVALGLLDGQNTRVEAPEAIRERLEWFGERAGEFDTAYVTTNTELFYLPVNKAEAKLASLGRVTREEVTA